MNGLDPNDFVDTDEIEDWDDYDADEITHAGFTIVPGDQVDHASLIYRADGVYGPEGSTRQRWGISLYYGYRYNGDDIPIPDAYARHILENLASHTPIEEYDWAGDNNTYFE